ncbi:MAG TPA: hypothetical protein VF172_12220 [Nitrososphaera sp.]
MLIGRQEGNIESGAMTDVTTSLTAEAPGNYTVRIFAQDGLQRVPAQPLSTITTANARVTE